MLATCIIISILLVLIMVYILKFYKDLVQEDVNQLFVGLGVIVCITVVIVLIKGLT